ncbi:AMP-binding enzyme C-terminal domain [Phytophthora cactorum]|nr:AMP-binding enzyme C-terminal domain [Phytophthora cactorum]
MTYSQLLKEDVQPTTERRSALLVFKSKGMYPLTLSVVVVSTFAGGLQKLGVKKGDCVVIYMPAVLETTVAMLACARLGAVHSVVFGGFATLELAARIEDAKPKLIISASCGVEPKGIIDYGPLLNGAIERSTWKPSQVVMMQRDLCPFPMTKGRDVDWRDVMTMGNPIDAVTVLATDPLYILYTSGTTGRPKGVVRDNGGHAVALKWAMRNVFDITPDDTFFAASDMGWTVGHSLVVYGPLVHGCTSVLYAGKPVGTPDAGAYWRLITEYGIKSMFTAPTALRAIRKEDPHALLLKDKKEEIRKTFQSMFVAGERGDPKTFNFFSEELGVPLIDHWWQTETGWPITAPCLGMQNNDLTEDGHPRIKVGSVARPVPGWDVQLLTADNTDDDANHGYNHEKEEKDAELVVKLPLPPGALTTLHNNPDDFHAKYFKRFPGYYHTGDTGHIDEEGFVYVMSRTDDVINVAGHRITTGSIEEVIIEIPEVVECAVFGVTDPLKGHVPVALLVIDKKIDRLKEKMGSFVCLKDVGLVDALPKTRSGKVMRATIQAIADSAPFRVPATIDNVAVLDDIRKVLQKLGYAKKKSVIGKVEKEALQQQVGELTTELAEVQKAKENERSLATSAWEMMAKRQLQARVNAEEKQRRLIRVIESRTALIQEFQGVMQHGLGNVHDDVAMVRIDPLSSAPDSSTLIRTMMRHVPMHFSSNSTPESAARQFTGFMLDTATEDALKIGNRMEKLLLQDK